VIRDPVAEFGALIEEVKFAHDLYGAFPCQGAFRPGCAVDLWLLFGFRWRFFVRSGKGRSSSRRLRSGSRSARKGSRDRNA